MEQLAVESDSEDEKHTPLAVSGADEVTHPSGFEQKHADPQQQDSFAMEVDSGQTGGFLEDSPISHRRSRPRFFIPRKTIGFALTLLILGLILISIGIYYIDYHRNGGLILCVIGAMATIPGVYQTYKIIHVFRGGRYAAEYAREWEQEQS